MIISQPLGLEQNETHKSGYFGDAMASPLSLTASVPSVGHNSISGSSQGVYPPSDGYFLPSRVQTDLPNMSMYVAPPDSTSISSPGNFLPNPASVATAPGLMSSHYAAGLQHPPCYPALGEDYEMRSGVGGVWHGSYAQPPASCYPYENGFGPQYHYDRYCGMDINDGVRRKNATRESTNTLKAWLQEHKKNPYPTKGEKIMLAIITKMTLTQVSTWFANARRRLKKENKMTWVPKNRSSDANNAGSKKTDDEDDDDVTSHLSQDNDCKSDIEQSVDSDDSDVQKVTSTNSSDDVTTTSDLKPTDNDFSNERTSVTTVSTCHHLPEDRDFRPQSGTEDRLQANYRSFDHSDKSWPSNGEATNQKSSETFSPQRMPSPYANNAAYLGSSTILPQSNARADSTNTKVDEITRSNELKYHTEWSASYPSSADPPRVDEQLETSRSPNHVSETKPILSRNSFGINAMSESVSPTAPSYAHKYQHPFPPTIEYYRSAERLSVEASYYQQNEINSRVDLKSERIPGGSFPGSQDPVQSKTPIYSMIPSPSHSTTDTISSNPKPLYHQNLSPQYYSNAKLIKAAPQTTTSFTGSYFQQESFNPPPSLGSNSDYYPKKDFYSPEAPGYHLPSSTSPRM